MIFNEEPFANQAGTEELLSSEVKVQHQQSLPRRQLLTERPYFACIQSNIMKKEETTNTERCVAQGNVAGGLFPAAAPAVPMTARKPERDPRGPNRSPSASLPPRLYVHLIPADASPPAARIAGALGDASGGGGCGNVPRDFPGPDRA